MSIRERALNFYDKKYKTLLVLSFVILLLSFAVLGVHYARTGEFFEQGVSLKGGITLTAPVTNADPQTVEASLKQLLPEADVSTRAISEAGVIKALIIETDASLDALTAAIPQAGVPLEEGTYTVENMGSALGTSFYRQTVQAALLAFIAMAIVVFLTFRKLVPSGFVILAAVSDIVSTLAVINLMGIKLTTAGIASFLMLIGYSVDTDILLTTRVLKRKGEGGNTFQRTVNAMKTGMTMSFTSFVAALIGYIFSQSDIIKQIMLIIAIGLVFDMIYTWMQNASILRWYMERKK